VKLTKVFFYLFLASIPFGTRALIHQFTTGFHEYEAVFIYLSDIFLILFLAAFLYELRGVFWQKPKFLIIFLLLSAVSIFFAVSKGLAFYTLIRLIVLAYAAFATAKIIRTGVIKIEGIFAVLAGSAVFQSLLGVAQFVKQRSLDLVFLGEPLLSTEGAGIAKIVVEGARVLRAYGTFPHPNILAAFLLLGLCSLYYLWLKSSNNEFVANKRIFVNSHFIRYSLISISIFITLLGLMLTFSRTAWLIAVLATLAIVILSRSGKLAILSLAAISIISVILSPYVLSRAKVSAQEPSVNYRLIYNQVGLDLIKNNLFGVGIGNQVLHSVKNEIYQKFGLDQVWQWQPVHNIYLLIAAEVGIVGGAALFIFLLGLLIPNLKFLISKQISNFQLLISTIMLLALLLFGLVDHFLWTLWPGQLMLWLVIGLLLGLTLENKPATLKIGSNS
jgi:O-antigen ligase